MYPPVTCDDGDACTVNDCDSAVGCLYPPVICFDGNACTQDTCDSAVGCLYPPVDCDDGNACTVDGCDTETGCVYDTLVCDDDDVCTEDSCDTETGCVFTPIPCETDCDDCIDDDMDGLTDCQDDQCAAAAACNVTYPRWSSTARPAVPRSSRSRATPSWGHVMATDGIASFSLTLNGMPLPATPDPYGAFVAPFAPRHGMNVIVAEVVSNAGTSDKAVQSFYYGTDWLPMDTGNTADYILEDAALGLLTAEFLDDDDTSDNDDLATLLTGVLQRSSSSRSSGTRSPTSPSAPCDYQVNVTSLRFGGLDVDVLPDDGVLEFAINASDVRIGVDVPAAGGCPPFVGEMVATNLEVLWTLAIEKDRGQPAVVGTTFASVTMDGFAFQPDCGPFCGYETYVRYVFQGLLEDELETTVRRSSRT